MMRRLISGAIASIAVVTPASAQVAPPAAASERLEIQPILDLRGRYETVDQGSLDADALTVRLRAGAEARLGHFSLLAEGEATVALIDDYNAFAFPLAGESQRRPQFAVVADPENVELNRLQLQYRSDAGALTLGRQRISLDDQRWVGPVGWRQNEQTFDAVRGEARLGPVNLDLTYAISQRTIFGEDAGPRTDFDGDFLFAGLSTTQGPVQGKLFAYLLDYDEAFFLANSSQTYGGILSGSIGVAPETRLTLRGSYARQSDLGANPFDYSADYWAFEGGTTLQGFTLAAGWERLGSDNGRAVQTPMATLHKFNGWADLFLTTPPAGLEDLYASIGRNFGRQGPLDALTFQLAFHQFDSAGGNLEYGTEWNASVGFGIGRVRILAKYADYRATGFGSDTRKFWLQAEWSL
ncbi:MAG TPA: alginate export family protein [Allosphingosinicella sp.]|nr:alginate export family protein [Allosphingosinicella sp.]